MILNRLTPERFFLYTALFFGSILLFIMPPFSVDDEANHLSRAYGIAHGYIVPVHTKQGISVYLPRDWHYTFQSFYVSSSKYHILGKDIQDWFYPHILWRELSRDTNPQDIYTKRILNTGLYSPIQYIPQIIGVYISSIWQANALQTLYAVRLCSLLFFIYAIYTAICIIPTYKYLLAVFALGATVLVQGASASADSTIIALSALSVAGIFTLLKDHSIKTLSWVALCLILLSTAKNYPVYLLLLLPLGIRLSKVYYLFTGLSMSIAIILTALWSNIIKTLVYIPQRAGVDFLAQMKWILHHPLQYIGVLFHTWIHNALGLTLYFKAFKKIAFLCKVPELLLIVYITLTIYLAMRDTDISIRFTRYQRLLIFIVYMLSCIMIATGMYMVYTEVSAGIIYGVLGRHFLPILLIGYMTLYDIYPLPTLHISQYQKYIYGFVWIYLSYMVYTILCHY